MQDPLADDRLDRVAGAIFAYRYPQAAYTDPLFREERADCLLLAVQFRAIFGPRWTVQTAVELLTDRSCELLFGDRLVNTNTRGEIRDYAESYIEDLNKLFGGADRRVPEGSEGWRYVPEQEPDDSEIEVVKKSAVN